MTVRYGMLAKSLNESKLRHLYENKLLTDFEIAKIMATELGFEKPFHERAVARLRKCWGIKSLTLRQRKERREGRSGPSLDDLTPEILRDIYTQIGERQIAKMYGVAKPAIQRLRHQWEIETVSKTDRSFSVIELSDEQKEVIIGCMLGDGYLLNRGVFKLSHAYHQYEYLKKIHQILHSIASRIFYEEKHMSKSGEIRAAFGFRTHQHRWIKELRDLFYPKGKRIFPMSVLEKLTERSLAYWYFDDGNLCDKTLPSFALGNVHNSNDIIKAIRKRFGFDVYISPRSTQTCQIMALRANSAGDLFNMIALHATSDMLHKIPEQFWPKEIKPAPKIQTSEKHQLPKSLFNCINEWDSSDENLVEDLFLFWRISGFPHHVARLEDILTLTRLEVEHVLQGNSLKARQVGQSSCQAFMPHIWDARNTDNGDSPRIIFENDDTFRTILRNLLNHKQVPNASEIRKNLSVVRNFRPSVAKILVDRYCPTGGIVYDPCGGWGGRLLGTLTSSAQARYVACEPSTRSFRGLYELSQWVDRYVPGAEKRIELHCIAAEEFEPPSEVSMVLTSPPYWRKEYYTDENTQSSARYETYERWLEMFWKIVIHRAVYALVSGGWLVLNVNNFVYRGIQYNLVQDTIDICSELGFGEPERLRYEMSSPVKNDNCEWTLVWCRSGVVSKIQERRQPVGVVYPVPEKIKRK